MPNEITPSTSTQADNNSTLARLLFDTEELRYNFGPQHPLQPARLSALTDLLECSGLWDPKDEHTCLPLRQATYEELSLVHEPEYIQAVQRLSQPLGDESNASQREERQRLELRFGFGGDDTPALPGMHEVAARIAGGTLVALSTVMGLPEGESLPEQERPLRVFHPSGACITPGRTGPQAFVSIMTWPLPSRTSCRPARPRCSTSILTPIMAMVYSVPSMMTLA
ncbi:hypothetical protein KSC_065640 [Ktedonobacter sp. SOSP1-52]|uniref:hypothetical protein n=1 Tax=Ktedonobacter sp. SOSP1-52 TaxID=2778366 RepID=UPI00191592E5|nr:hypothetical protein [Ktedonobacter sp. SOSP1-52]GHO67672.1 hypothetical protein KSC_065640 [Ktedonobacter sp. SOSP1-52]